MRHDWVLWQLCDSAFPAGALMHSGGLEAAWQGGAVGDADVLFDWAFALIHQTCHTSIPAVVAAWSGTPLGQVDAFCESMLLSHVANRASRAQGQALLMACGKTFDSAAVRRVAGVVKSEGLAGHFASAFGAVGQALDVREHETCAAFAFMALRGVVSSAVRLGIVGPLQGQNLQHRLSARAAPLVRRCMEIPLERATPTAPLADLFQATQDRLYSRLFVS